MNPETTPILLPVNKRGWRDLMASLKLRPSKGLGQNFLTDSSVVDRMVNLGGITRRDTVVEVGPGLGILTNALAKRVGPVIAVERDPLLANHIAKTFAGSNVIAVEGDALQVNWDNYLEPGEPWSVVANLPYSAAAAIVRRFLELEHPPEKLVVMFQRQVAERMIATPPDMSVLGVATQFYATGELLFIIPPDVFIPSPKVESAVLLLHRRQELLLPLADHPRFFRLVNAGFRLKRKTIANSMSKLLLQPKADVETWLQKAGIDPIRRAETLVLEDWIALFHTVPDTVGHDY